MGFLSAFYRFSRPHTIVGTTLSIVVTSWLALKQCTVPYNQDDVNWAVLVAIASALCMNIYIVGLNQLFDIAIDKINKPDLPLASGEFTVPFAVLLVGGCGLASVALGLAFGSTPLLYTLVGSGVLGTIYSTDLPLLRWKRHPVLAGGCILVVRGLIVQIGFYSHIQAVIPGIAASWYQSPVILFSMAFITIFSIVIALFKDIPDVDGDKKHNVRSLSVRIGVQRVFDICLLLVLLDYALGLGVGLMAPPSWQRAVAFHLHLLLAIYTYGKSQTVNLSSKASIWAFYMFLWKLFYVEYFIMVIL